MRPPSYYASIVRSNNNHYSSTDFDTSTASSTVGARTSSASLRSSLSSPSSSSYVSRSHLPFVPQSTLVAHCFTGVGSSTRPYSSTPSTSTPTSTSSSSSASYNSSLGPSSLSSRVPSTKRPGSHLTGGGGGGHHYHHSSYTSPSYNASSSLSSSASTGRSSAYLRPSYLSPSSSSSSSSTFSPSSRPSYRPIAASSYYQPIRLRERPLLTQISSQLGQRRASRRDSSSHSAAAAAAAARKSSATRPNDVEANHTTTREVVGTTKSAPSDHSERDDQDEARWSSDITRNISRNKYLIKFREIDKQARPSLACLDAVATIQLPADDNHDDHDDDHDDEEHQRRRRGRESVVPDREPSESPVPTDDLSGKQARNRDDTMKLLADDGTGACDNSNGLTGITFAKVAPSSGEPALESRTRKRRVVGKTRDQLDQVDSKADIEIKDELKDLSVPKKRNVKLKLKPLGTSKAKEAANKREPDVEEAEKPSLTPKITPAKQKIELTKPVETKAASTVPESKLKSKQEPAKVVAEDDLQDPKSQSDESSKSKTAVVKVKKVIKTSKKTDDTPAPSTGEESEQTKRQSIAATAASLAAGQEQKENQEAPVAAKPTKKLIKKKTDSGEKKSDEKRRLKVLKKSASEKKLVEPPQIADHEAQQQQQQQQQVASPPVKTGGRIRFRAYNYDDFNFLTVLGHGGWGFVILAELKNHEACFAVKCIKKITIVEDDDYDSIMIERKVLALGNVHPFICKLFCTFETSGYLFFVMEYCAGGDLMFHVQREGKFTEPRCRFYAAEIICAIRFLHNRHIIYRDLKLDNILLDARGHVRLVDFGMCQCRTYREEMLPSNFCGTPEYISPEIIKGVPYNHSVDWWSFGVLLYEMAVGKMPFRGNDENELLWNVCYEQIHYPMFLTKELTSLLKLLLEREPTKRMGMATCKAGDIHDQPFFRSVDWKAVEELRVPPPFVPEVTSNRDVQNFDSDFTESTCELSPVDRDTLDKIDQKQFEKFPYTNPDISIFDQPPGNAPSLLRC